MTMVRVLNLLAFCCVLAASLLGCSSESGSSDAQGDPCERTQAHLQGCGFLSEGHLPWCSSPANDDLRCRVECLAQASCEDAGRFVCERDDKGFMATCTRACLNAVLPFQCASGEFVSNAVCDGQTDCLDGSDEKDCPGPLRGGDFRCNDGFVIGLGEQCDGVADCIGGEDERCFECGSGELVPSSTRCSGTRACSDGSDDMGCAQTLCSAP